MALATAGPSVTRCPASTITSAGRLTLTALLLATIVLQRLGLPMGPFSLPVILPLGLAALGILAWRGDVRPMASRVALFMVAVATMAAAAYLAARYSTEVSLFALLLVLAVWSPWVLRAHGSAEANTDGFRRIGTLYKNVMVGLALVGVVQLLSQFMGLWRYQDYLGSFVPSQFLLPGYNTSIPLSYGSPIVKSQAFVFLEPGHFSQFTAVAIVIAILLGARLWQVAVLGLGLVSSLSGTGLLLVGIGVLAILVRTPRLVRPAYVIAAALGVAAALLTPLSDVFATRVNETTYQTSSLSLRFVLPYQETAEGMREDPQRWISGAGPAATDRFLESGQDREGLHVVYTIPTKLLFEYGFFAGAAFLAFLLVSLFRGPPAVVLPITLLAWLFLMGGYLAIPCVVWAAWLLSPVWSIRE